MNELIQTLHPDPSKQGVRIEKDKYDTMRETILLNLKQLGAVTFTELSTVVEHQLSGRFDGSVMWYFTTVKLDLEARGELRRVPKSKPQLVELATR